LRKLHQATNKQKTGFHHGLIAVLLVFVAGYLVGIGHVFTPVASAIIITMFLAWKVELRKFAGGHNLLARIH
jgi:uncharacterized membrane protein (DUF4010 family)